MELSQKKLFLLDLDGTVYLEESLLPGAANFLTWVRETGSQVRYLTNNSSRGVDAGLTKMHRLGVPAVREEFLTAVEAAIRYLHQERGDEEAYYVVGTDSFHRQLREAGFDVRETPDSDVTAVLVSFDTTLTYEKVENACRVLARGVDFLATNPDLACPTLFGFVPDCGSICRMLSNACGREPVFIGKPAPTMIEMALAPDRVCPGGGADGGRPAVHGHCLRCERRGGHRAGTHRRGDGGGRGGVRHASHGHLPGHGGTAGGAAERPWMKGRRAL